MLLRKYKAMNKLSKTFLWLTIPIVIVFTCVYSIELHQALNMDPNSFNCKYDSMMMQICHHPYSSSIGWTLILIGYFSWPVLITWVILGGIVLGRFIKRKRSGHAPTSHS